MRILILYDTMFGNTEKIAAAVAGGFLVSNDVRVSNIENIDVDLKNLDLLIIGSPSLNGRPMPSIQEFLESTQSEDLKNIQFACFDVRIDPVVEFKTLSENTNPDNYAASKMDKVLSSKKAKWIIPPRGFIKLEKEGPLKEGEEELATNWAKKIIAKVGAHISSY